MCIWFQGEPRWVKTIPTDGPVDDVLTIQPRPKFLFLVDGCAVVGNLARTWQEYGIELIKWV